MTAPTLDWEVMAANRLARVVNATVRRIREAADQIERDAAHNIVSAASGEQGATYIRTAERAINELHMLVSNVGSGGLIDAAHSADVARLEKVAKRDRPE